MTCNSPDLQKYCAQIYSSVPTCPEINNDLLPPSLPISDNPYETGIAFQLFEMSNVLIEKGMVIFRSSGTCMYPSLKPGDRFFVQPKTAEQIRVGEIAVYRHFKRIFAHRAIAKGKQNGQSFIFTRPDRSRFGMEGPFYDNDLMGVVSIPAGKYGPTDWGQGNNNLIGKIFLHFGLQYYSMKGFLLKHIMNFVTFIQKLGFYQLIAALIFSFVKVKMDFSIQTPLHNKINNRFNNILSYPGFPVLNLTSDENRIAKLLFTLKINSNPAAFLSFFIRPANCPFPGCWVTSVKTRMRFRGTGIEEIIFKKAEDFLRQSKVSQIFVSIFFDESGERNFFSKFGFMDLYTFRQPNFLGGNNSKMGKQIIMKKDIH